MALSKHFLQSLALFLLAAFLFATGGLFMKSSHGLTRWGPSAAVFGCFCAGAACQAIGMRDRDMGPAYTLVLGFEAILAVLFSAVILHEGLTMSRVLAIAVTVVGLAWLEHG